jgi:hypothetical protein
MGANKETKSMWEGLTNCATYLTVIGGIMVIVGALLKDMQNDALQQKLTNLTQSTLTEVTGSPEAYVEFYPVAIPGDPTTGTKDTLDIRPFNSSNYPVIAADVSFSNMTGNPMGEIPLFSWKLGDVYDGKTGPSFTFNGPLRKDIDNKFNLIMNSRSVVLSEDIVVSWTGEKWVSDYKLVRMDDGRKNTLKVIKEIRSDFPYLEKNTPQK